MRKTLAWILMAVLCGVAAQSAGDNFSASNGGGGLLVPNLDDFGVNADRYRDRAAKRYVARKSPSATRSAPEVQPTEPIDIAPSSMMAYFGAGALAGLVAIAGAVVVFGRRKRSSSERTLAVKLIQVSRSDVKPLKVVAPESNDLRRAA